MRQQVEGLRDRSTPNGRTSTAPLKVPGIAALPAGMTRSGATITNNSYAGDLEDWDFRGHTVVVKTAMGAIRQCLFGELTGQLSSVSQYLYGETGASVADIEHNDFTGPFTFGGAGAAINARAGLSAAKFARIRCNRFTGLTSDSVKALSDDQLIEWNYFGPPVNLPSVPTTYSAAASYAVGDLVRSAQGHVWRALQAGTLPIPPTTKGGTSTAWQNLDPHADAITTVMVRNRLTIARNLFDFVPTPIGASGPLPQTGVNNALRISRNTGSDLPIGEIIVEENVTYHTPEGNGSFPIEAKDGSQPNFNGPIRFRGNWVGANANKAYFSTATNGWVDEWAGNRDSASDAVIPGPTLRVRPEPPVSVVAPVLGGTSREGETLTVSPGTWGGTTPMSFAYRWLRNTTDISGATGATYVQTADDVGAVITCEVTATNAAGSTPVRSNPLGATQSAGPAQPSRMVLGFMGRSNMDFLTANTPVYIDTSIPRPSFATRTDPVDPSKVAFRANCTFVGKNPQSGTPGNEGALVVRAVNDSTAASSLNMGMLSVAEWLGRAKPGMDFMLKAFDKGGTTFEELLYDGETNRLWEHFLEVQNHAPDWGDPALVQDFWLVGNDFFDAYAPGMLRQLEDGSPFVLGSPNPKSGSTWTVDHCIFDANAAQASDRGEGVWPRTTKFHEMRREDQLSYDAALDAWLLDSRNDHWVEPLGAFDVHLWDGGHARRDSIFGQYYGGFMLIPAIARELGFPVYQPQEYRQVTSADGMQTRIYVKLPNGGDLTTMRKRANEPGGAFPTPFPTAPLSWQHEVSSLSVKRPNQAQTRIHRRDLPTDATGLASAPLASRATVTLENAGTGTGANREGCILIQWEQPIENGALVYVRHKFDPGHGWQSTMPFLDFPIETVPAITFDDLMIPFPGLSLRPWMPPLTVAGVGSSAGGGSGTGDGRPAPAAFWTQAASGPYFKDPSSVPDGTRRIRIRSRFRVPSSVPAWSGDRFLAAHETDGFNVVMWRSAAGKVLLRVGRIEDGGGQEAITGGIGSTALGTSTIPDDVWHTHDIYGDLVDAQVVSMLDGGAAITAALPNLIDQPSFTTGREMTLGARVGGGGAIDGVLPQGIQFEYLEVLFYDAALNLIRSKRIAGTAAAVNADSWRGGTLAT